MAHRIPTAAFVALFVALGVGGCSVQAGRTADLARSGLIGVSAADLSMCAGLPSRIEKIDGRTELRAYEYKNDAGNAITVNMPVVGGGLSLGQGGNCKATFRMTDGRVSELRYAGDTASPGARDAVCAPIVAHCMEDLPARVAAR